MTPEATTDVELQTHVYTSAARVIAGHPNRTFSPATSTLVTGDTEAVLIDAQYTESEVSALGDMIERTGTRLTSIFITHGHYDHYYGLGQLVARFPQARPVASAPVVADIHATLDFQAKQWQEFFGDVPKATVLPQALERSDRPRRSRAARDRNRPGRHRPEHGGSHPVDRHRYRG
jgi:glyoxylase-like metal-dependent hydrolase (beta-lactamase superfamily II)